jgi:hypothetical protein
VKKIRWTLTGVMEENGQSPEQEHVDFTNGEYEFADLVGVSEEGTVVYEFKWEEEQQ